MYKYVCAQPSVKYSGQPSDTRQCCEAADSDDEDRMQNKMRQYEKKIEVLLEQVAELEKEVYILSVLVLFHRLYAGA